MTTALERAADFPLQWRLATDGSSWWVDTRIGRLWVHIEPQGCVFEYRQPRGTYKSAEAAKEVAEAFYQSECQRRRLF